METEGWIEKINCYHATQCDVGVSLHSRTHRTCSAVMALLSIPVSELVSFLFLQSLYVPFEFFYIGANRPDLYGTVPISRP